ncbi:DUF1236 domain-containing protein [Phreatobacter aquaticus]|nr:DUF1236 domain-containing protein [Phreatobacter aquaticus]
MKKLLLASAIALASATSAFAQAGTLPTAPGANSAVVAPPTAQQQTMIRDYWRRTPHAAVQMPNGVNVSTGDTLPDSVELRPLPNDMGMTEYRYIVVGQNLYLVNPANRRVVHVIQ